MSISSFEKCDCCCAFWNMIIVVTFLESDVIVVAQY
jgi:hypothetical protein